MDTQRTRRRINGTTAIAFLRGPFASFALKSSFVYCLAASVALADVQSPPAMTPDAANALLPAARSNLGLGTSVLPFGLRDDSAGTPAAGGTGNAVGDQLTLNDGCATHAVVAVGTVSSGAVTAYNVVKRGSCASPPANPVGVLSTTGTGSGATFTLNWGPLAAGIQFGSLANGQGNLFLSADSSPSLGFSGTESTFVGIRAGGGLLGSNFHLAVGHDACGIGGTGTNGASMMCLGTDAGRNLNSGAARDLLVGVGAGENVSGTDDIVLLAGGGNSTGLTSGSQDTLVHGGATLATGAGDVVIGYKSDVTGSAVIIGGNNNGGGIGARGGGSSVVIGAQAGNGSLTGLNQVIIGQSAGATNCGTGNGNIVIGQNQDCLSLNGANGLNIGGFIEGDLAKKHLVLAGTTPGIGSGTGDCGTSPSIAGSDSAGLVTVGSSTNGGKCTITFAQAWTTAPICLGLNQTTGNLIRPVTTTTTLALTGTLTAADKLSFVCAGYQL